jgi:hypothetical protein
MIQIALFFSSAGQRLVYFLKKASGLVNCPREDQDERRSLFINSARRRRSSLRTAVNSYSTSRLCMS